MGPITTGLGDVFQFTVEGEGVSAMERRTILDWKIAPRLRAVPGVTEVNTWGGLPKQYQVVVDPAKLRAHGLSLKEVFEAVERGSTNAGGGYIEHNREQYIVRGEGLVGSLADIEKIVLKAERRRERPITVGNVAQVREGAMLRIGAATADGRGETVIGLVQMLAGENALAGGDAGSRRPSRSSSRRCPRASGSCRSTTARRSSAASSARSRRTSSRAASS